MATQSDHGRSYQANEALAAFRIVQLTSGKAAYVDAGAATFDVAVGVTQNAVAADEHVNVRGLGAGTFKLTASAAITAGDYIIAANDGKVAPDGGGGTEPTIGRAITAASADGGVIEAILNDKTNTLDLS